LQPSVSLSIFSEKQRARAAACIDGNADSYSAQFVCRLHTQFTGDKTRTDRLSTTRQLNCANHNHKSVEQRCSTAAVQCVRTSEQQSVQKRAQQHEKMAHTFFSRSSCAACCRFVTCPLPFFASRATALPSLSAPYCSLSDARCCDIVLTELKSKRLQRTFASCHTHLGSACQ
jgi:hypothetical protein